jgi:cytochrome P450
MVENDIGIDAMARVEAVLAFGLLVNSVPTTFWTMFEIYRRPELLQDLRQEVAQNALHIETSDSKTTHVIDLDSIRKLCPHLVSTFQETLRLRMKGSLVRMIMKDTLLDPQNPDIKEQYLLKEGSLLQVTAGHFNQSAEFWGSDVLTFNSRRFMQLKNTSKARQGFLAFGTAPNTCPGRQFASGEILSLVAMLILRYDITPVGGEWIEPEINTTSLSAAVMPPKGQFMVEAKDSGQYKGCEWKFRVGEGNGRFNLIIG